MFEHFAPDEKALVLRVRERDWDWERNGGGEKHGDERDWEQG